jgi:hypothetical protein
MLNNKIYQIGLVGAAVYIKRDVAKTGLILEFRKCFENSSTNSYNHAANSFFDWKLKLYKLL